MPRYLVSLLLLALLCAPAFAGSENSDPAEMKLEASYEQIEQVPVSVRRDVFQHQTPSQKSSLWKEHLTKFQALEMTSEQKAVLEATIAAISPDFFSESVTESSYLREQFQQLDESLRAVFPAEIVRYMVAVLGPPQRGINDLPNLKPSKMYSPETSQAQDSCQEFRGSTAPQPCGCSIHSDFCGRGWRCSDAVECIERSSGCGIFWVWPCDGHCCFALFGGNC